MKKTFIALVFSLFFGVAFSQSAAGGSLDQSFLNDFVRRHYTTADGLPGMTITDIMQDKKGYIYIGTYDGLVRFDGLSFTTWRRGKENEYTFASARAILQDSDENIWVGSNDEGLQCLSSKNSVTFTTQNGLPNNSVRSIVEDKKKNIWVGTSAGVVCLTHDKHLINPQFEAGTVTKASCAQAFTATQPAAFGLRRKTSADSSFS